MDILTDKQMPSTELTVYVNMADLKLPIIDLAKAADPKLRLEVAKTLCDAAANIGFLYVENVTGHDEDELARWCKWIFDQPKSVTSKLYRQIWNPDNKNVYRGFFPTVENDSSFKEAFEIGSESRLTITNEKNPWFNEENVWPVCEGSEDFKTFATAYFDLMMEVSLELCRLFCLGSGLEEKSLEYAFVPGTVSTLRFLHYPIRNGPVPQEAFEGETVVATAEHADTSFFTILATLGYTGLQLKDDSGNFIDVPNRKNAFVVNIGDVMSMMTGGYFKATRHRVLAPVASRYTVPFFLEPRPDVDIGTPIPGFKQNTESVTYGDWMVTKIKQFAEYKHLFPPEK